MNFRRRLRTRHPRNRCAFTKCKEVAVRFLDAGPERRWLCAGHFEIEKEAKNGSDTKVKSFADKTAKTVREHLEMAKEINAKLK